MMNKMILKLAIGYVFCVLPLISCTTQGSSSLSNSGLESIASTSDASSIISSSYVDPNNPMISTKNRTYYQILIYSFADSDGDGFGDFKGIADKFDYLKNLGVNGLYLSPAQPASSYHGYDVRDYYMINPRYEVGGYTFDDFLADCQANDIAVVMDLVLNHTSSEHTWFTEGLNAFKNNTASKYKTYYTFSLTQTTQCPNSLNGVYYESLFSSNMPDLNYDNEEVRTEAINIGKFWLNKGVSGFRLDGAMHIFTNYASPTFSTDKWNNDIYDKNIAWWNEFYLAMQEENENVYVIGEVWTSEEKIKTYYASGLDGFFNFDARGKVTNALSGTVDYSLWLKNYQASIRSYQSDGIESYFLDNHDLARFAGVINDVTKLKMASALQILAPGNPFVYYGDEIGLKGSGGTDDKSFRTPMLWGDSYVANPSQIGLGSRYTSSTVSGANALAQIADEDSLFQYYKDVIALKNTNKELYSGTLQPIAITSNDACAYTVSQDGFISLVVHNLSDANMTFDLNLSESMLSGYVSVDHSEVTLIEHSLFMPALSSGVLRISNENISLTVI